MSVPGCGACKTHATALVFNDLHQKRIVHAKLDAMRFGALLWVLSPLPLPFVSVSREIALARPPRKSCVVHELLRFSFLNLIFRMCNK